MKEDTLVQFKLMLPVGLKARVEAYAGLNRRSLSQEIVAALEKEYPEPQADYGKEHFETILTELKKHGDDANVRDVIAEIESAIAHGLLNYTADELHDLMSLAVTAFLGALMKSAPKPPDSGP